MSAGELQKIISPRRLKELYRHNRPELFRIIRYLAVGVWNTLFGVGIFTILSLLLNERYYLLLSLFCNIIAITNAFLCYRYIVFRSQGSFWREYFRCYIVYGAGSLTGMAILALLVEACGFPPVTGNLISTAVVVSGSYLGHRFFSFRSVDCGR